MKRSTNRILTSHAGSLPRPDALLEVNRAKIAGEASTRRPMPSASPPRSARSAAHQAELGIDVINDGEFGKASRGAIDYGPGRAMPGRRLSGWEHGRAARAAGARRPARPRRSSPISIASSTARVSSRRARMPRRPPVFTGPITYIGQDAVKRRHRQFQGGARQGEGRGRLHHLGRAGQLRAPAEPVLQDRRGIPVRARRRDARGIQGDHRCGFVLQLDDPGLPDNWDLANPEPTLDGLPEDSPMVRVEALNHALERPARGPHPLSHLLGKLARAARDRPAARRHRRRACSRCTRGASRSRPAMSAMSMNGRSGAT